MTSTVCWFALYCFALGLFRGLHQAQVMVKPVDWMHTLVYPFTQDEHTEVSKLLQTLQQFDLGVRGHVWFKKYHAIDVGQFVAYTLALLVFLSSPSVILVLLGLAVTWLVYEPVYSYGRYRTLMDTNYPEHVVFLDVIDFHASKVVMTLVRLALVCTLAGLTIGG